MKSQYSNCDYEEQGTKFYLFILDKCKYELEQILDNLSIGEHCRLPPVFTAL